MIKIKTLLFVILLLSSMISYSQKGRIEKIKEECKDLPLSKRTVVAVSSFSISIQKNDSSKFNPNALSDMLTNALFNTNCFSVLERKNLKEIITEQDLNNGVRFDKKTSTKLGSLKGASMLIIGNVTEFSESSSGIGVGGLLKKVVGGVGKIDAHLGMIIKIIDTKTGLVLDSKSFERKVTKAGALGGTIISGAPVVAGGWTSKAMDDAAEELIIDIVEYVSKVNKLKDNEKQLSQSENFAKNKEIEVVINKTSYASLLKIQKTLEIKSVKVISKKFENQIATIIVSSKENSDKIAEYLISCKCGINLEVESIDDNKIVMQTK